MLENFAILGDLHGHLQLALCMVARWQKELALKFDGVFLCGDVGTFTDAQQLDNAIIAHGRLNSCELEFLNQWAPNPPAPWLQHIFWEDDGLGLTCPIVMIHGNHEGFAHLQTLAPRRIPDQPVSMGELPPVDQVRVIRYLPSGWRVKTAGGTVFGGIGGMERGQRAAKYHDMAYIDDNAVESLMSADSLDVLITHQGPQATQVNLGSPTLDMLLDQPLAKAWFHGHGVTNPAIQNIHGCQIVPLGEVAFNMKGQNPGTPGLEGWARLQIGPTLQITREPPPFWRDYHQKRWTKAGFWGLVSPDLVQYIPRNL
jgi:predicted phosphodiesterase